MRKRSGRPPRFAAVPNETVDDADHLDMEALGLLTVVLRHRDGYEITLPEIAEKYGYGRDGLAGAWGLLQVARYVVKVKIQWAGDNQFGTEVVVYDTPASDEEIQDLLASIAREPNVRAVQLVPPTKTAREKAAKHLAKVEAKRKSKPERRKLDFDVPKQGETGRGRGGRGGGEDRAGGGAGAAAPAKQPARKAAAKKKEPGKRLSKEQAAAVRMVKEGFPEQLREMLPQYLPPVLRDAILEALDSRTPEVLVDRVQRRWWAHGYEAAAAPGGKGIGSPVGVAIALVRPSTDCPEPLCEDGVTLDKRVPCRTCEQRREDRKTDRVNGVPAQRGEASGPAPVRWTCVGCHTIGKGEGPEDGRCRTCRQEAEAAEAARQLQERLDQEAEERARVSAERWDAMLEEAYDEHAARERVAARKRAEADAARQRTQAEQEETRRLREQMLRDHPELAAYSQTG